MKHSITQPRLVSPTSHFYSDGLYLLVHPSQPRWIVLNNVGHEVALLCDGSHSIARIAKHLARTYNLEVALASRHVKQYLSSLTQNGWLFPVPPVEVEASSGLDSLCIQITERCNLLCKHCHAWDDSRPPAELSQSQIKSMVDQAADMGVKVLTLSGGEPLLHPQFSEIVKDTSSRLKTQVLTNATLIDNQTAEFLADHQVKVQVSLDGAIPETHDQIRGAGAFVKTLRSIRHLREAGVEMVVSTVNMQINAGEEEAIARLAHEYGSSYSRFIPLRCSGNAINNWENLQPTSQEYVDFCRRYLLADHKKYTVNCGLGGLVLNLPKDQPRWCPIGRNLVINARGDIYPCILLMERDQSLGHIGKIGLSRVLSSPKLKRLEQIRDTRPFEISKCAACPWKNLCQAGCMGQSYIQKNSFWETDDFCSLRHELFPKLIFKLARQRSSHGSNVEH